MKGGEKGLVRGDKVKVDYGTGPPVEGKIFQSQGNADDQTDTLYYKVQWDTGKISEWIAQYNVFKLSADPPVPAEGQGRKRKTRRKRSKRRKTHRR
jgi:hypothetical protein